VLQVEHHNMGVSVKVKSESLLALREELIALLERSELEIKELTERIINTDSYFYCSAVEVIKAKGKDTDAECMVGINTLRKHIETLSDIASEYENAELENKEVVDEIGI